MEIFRMWQLLANNSKVLLGPRHKNAPLVNMSTYGLHKNSSLFSFLCFFVCRGVAIAQSVERRLRAGRPGFDSRQEYDFSLGLTQPPIQWVPGALSPGVKRPGRESDHSPATNAKVKNGGAIPPLLHMFSWRHFQLIKHRDNFTFVCRCVIWRSMYNCTLTYFAAANYIVSHAKKRLGIS
jgi:hypothetical protein